MTPSNMNTAKRAMQNAVKNSPVVDEPPSALQTIDFRTQFSAANAMPQRFIPKMQIKVLVFEPKSSLPFSLKTPKVRSTETIVRSATEEKAKNIKIMNDATTGLLSEHVAPMQPQCRSQSPTHCRRVHTKGDSNEQEWPPDGSDKSAVTKNATYILKYH